MPDTSEQSDRFLVRTPASALEDNAGGLDAIATFGYATPPNGVGLSLSNLFSKGCTLAISIREGNGDKPTEYALYTMLDTLVNFGLVALRRWYIEDGKATYEDEAIPLHRIFAIQRPTATEVQKLFSRICSRCEGHGKVTFMNQPCDECSTKGYVILREATRRPFSAIQPVEATSSPASARLDTSGSPESAADA